MHGSNEWYDSLLMAAFYNNMGLHVHMKKGHLASEWTIHCSLWLQSNMWVDSANVCYRNQGMRSSESEWQEGHKEIDDTLWMVP